MKYAHLLDGGFTETRQVKKLALGLAPGKPSLN